MDKRRLPASLVLVALAQVIAVIVLPPSMLMSISLPIGIVIAAVFGLLGLNLLRLRDWARVATVFVQGFSIIVRLLTLLSNVVPGGADAQLDVTLLVTSLVSMLLSGCVLYLIEKPDIQLIMQR
jgi:hypothetical protein